MEDALAGTEFNWDDSRDIRFPEKHRIPDV